MKTAAALAITFALIAPAAAGPDAAPAKTTRLDALKALTGTWKTGGEGDEVMTVTYRVTSAGSAVMETLFPGTDNEMVTMYTMNGDDLVLTHYCAFKNQPHMKAEAEKDPKVLAFTYTGGGNLKSRDEMHMDSLTMTITDATHIRHEWTVWKDGKAVGVKAFDLTKKAD